MNCDNCKFSDVDFGNAWHCTCNKCEIEVRADERSKIIHEILTEYESAVKSDNEASTHGDIFPHHVEDFWMKLKAGDKK